jgi:hypothetical protein
MKDPARAFGLPALAAAAILLAVSLFGCGGGAAGSAPPPGSASPLSVLRLPLTDMGSATYQGFSGGLYPAGNTLPPQHAGLGIQRALAVEPLDASGQSSPQGKYVLLSIGMSNTTMEYCGVGGAPDLSCTTPSFGGQALADPAVNHAQLAIVDGALGGRSAEFWVSPQSPEYDRVRDNMLAPLGLSEAQVQAVWLKVANPAPSTSLPSQNADAFVLLAQMGSIVRALRVRYPNLAQVFVSSRIYGGYATTALNPEPYAYESGFAVKWLIESQIRQLQTGAIDPRAGDLDPYSVAPWLAWGPYMWADGANPRSDGLAWLSGDFTSDGTHPSPAGVQKVGSMLLDFFRQSPQTRCWFLENATCP